VAILTTDLGFMEDNQTSMSFQNSTVTSRANTPC